MAVKFGVIVPQGWRLDQKPQLSLNPCCVLQVGLD